MGDPGQQPSQMSTPVWDRVWNTAVWNVNPTEFPLDQIPGPGASGRLITSCHEFTYPVLPGGQLEGGKDGFKRAEEKEE